MGSSSGPWKDLERRTAKALGGTRLWRPSFADSIPDGESETHTWDCKCYARHAVVSMFVDAELKYRVYNAGRRFIMVLFSRDRNQQGDFVLLRMKDYRELLVKAGELEAEPSQAAQAAQVISPIPTG